MNKLKSIKINYYLALLFGLIHGMGFANSIRMMLASNQNIGWGLFGFNVGLEVGQIFMVMLILFVTWIVFNYTSIKRLSWVIFVSAAVLALSLQMALERMPF